MATRTYRVDDLDRTSEVTGDPTTVALNGRTVQLDLSEVHAKELADLLAPYFEAGTEVTRTRKAAGSGTQDADRNAEIRAWALDNGHKVSDRGRLPGAVVEAFEAWEREQDTTPADEPTSDKPARKSSK